MRLLTNRNASASPFYENSFGKKTSLCMCLFKRFIDPTLVIICKLKHPFDLLRSIVPPTSQQSLLPATICEGSIERGFIPKTPPAQPSQLKPDNHNQIPQLIENTSPCIHLCILLLLHWHLKDQHAGSVHKRRCFYYLCYLCKMERLS